jgi:hypothetical protein
MPWPGDVASCPADAFYEWKVIYAMPAELASTPHVAAHLQPATSSGIDPDYVPHPWVAIPAPNRIESDPP